MADIITIVKFLSTGVIALIEVIPASVAISLVLGIIIGILGYLQIPIIRYIVSAYIIAMRGLPPLTLLLLVFFSGSFVSPIVTAIVVLSVYHGAYIAEIVRAGISAIPKGQHEGADSIGLSVIAKMVHVIMPQVWLSIIPSLVGQYIILIKDTTLISAIGVMELLNNARQIMQVVYRPITVYVIVAVFFFVICFFLENLSKHLERRIKAKTIL
ncbi:amino acid ABC transporter permease [Sediminispirochaeta smaragdinae]|uniref:Polar amino acid ABC transporter, inner membrane subunit n=1 Tax=Sediminispirochaeta smaragdinae (strain DSM 11293 / JCM 15392 / SEBR 4228) TaxID=573413 RepID=E1RCH3_SEDSS|nr:amino acid ABC transporter permease [Sediminispirochaeta smaragdinae]ADK80053.1 polar amino acid ABC transporter, inner membrane subunit [Sediminispirochaeta smaragdinae DSM 11293]